MTSILTTVATFCLVGCVSYYKGKKILKEVGDKYKNIKKVLNSFIEYKNNSTSTIKTSNTTFIGYKNKSSTSTRKKSSKYVCAWCNAVFRKNTHCKEHIEQTHFASAKPFQCNRCAKKFNCIKQLNRHIKNCENSRIR